MLTSEATLRRRIRAKIASIGNAEIILSGSFVRKGRKCGNPHCACANGGALHPTFTVTSKVCGKTKSIYIPVDMAGEVEGWVLEHKRIKKVLKEVDELAEQLIRLHVERRLAARRRSASLESPTQPT